MSTSNATSTADWEKARARRKSGKKAVDDEPAPVDDDDVEKVIAQFVSSEGEEAGPQVYLPLNTTPARGVDQRHLVERTAGFFWRVARRRRAR